MKTLPNTLPTLPPLPTISIFAKKSNKEGDEVSLFIRASFKGERTYYGTGIKVPATNFNGKEIIGNVQNKAYYNSLIRSRYAEVEAMYIKQAAMGILPGKKEHQPRQLEADQKFCEYGIAMYEAMKFKCEAGYCDRSIACVKDFQKFAGNVTFAQISVQLLENYEAHLYQRELAPNTINRMFKRLRQVANDAELKHDIRCKAFKIYKHTSFKQTERSYLTIEQIQLIQKVEVDNPCRKNVQNAFIIACNTGLRFSDVKAFDYKKNIVENDGIKRIVLQTEKTKALVSIMVNEEIDQRLKQLQPLPTNVHTNRELKELGKLAGINGNITFHMARHSFATNILNAKGNIVAISKLLGHTNIRTTQIYAQAANPMLDEAVGLLHAKSQQ